MGRSGAAWRTSSSEATRCRAIFRPIKNTSANMAKTVLIDSGAIVAALRRRDQHHAWARGHFEDVHAHQADCSLLLKLGQQKLAGKPLCEHLRACRKHVQRIAESIIRHPVARVD